MDIETEPIISRKEHKKFLTGENIGATAIATAGLVASVSIPAMAADTDPLAGLSAAATSIGTIVGALGATVILVVTYKVGAKMFKGVTSQS